MELRQPTVEQKTLEAVHGLLEELGGSRALGAVHLNASLERDLGLGSLERVELITRLESDFSVELPDSVLADAETLRDLVRAVLSCPGPTWRPAGKQDVTSTAGLPLPENASTLVEVLALRARKDPRGKHLYLQENGDDEQTIRYEELYREGVAVAGGLASRGVGLGDTVALMLPTSRDFFLAYAGVLLAGAVPVPLYPPFRLDRIEEYAGRQAAILRNAGARWFITVSRGRSMGRLLKSLAPELQEVTTVDDLVSRASPAPAVEVGPDAPALIQYTSGSTGQPKGVLLTHRNLLANIKAIGRALDLRGTDVGVSWLPLYHDMGLIGCWLTPLYFGIPMAILAPMAFLSRPERWLWTIHTHRATHSPSPNFGFELCVRRIRDEAIEGLDLSCWKGALNGAEPVSVETIERFTRRFSPYGFRREAMMPVYGLAESSVALAATPLLRGPRIERISRERFESEGLALPAGKTETCALRFVSVGKPLFEHEVRIVDEERRPVPDRKEGVLEFRGPSTMQGYYRNPVATREVVRPDGWVDSGDRAFVAEGEIFITGRSKDIIIRAGRNIYPQEVEEIVSGVEGVRRGCVAAFGVPDEQRGTEKLVVVAETRDDEDTRRRQMGRAIQERLSELLGAPADDVVLVPPGTVPKTSSGKIRRSACKGRYIDGDLIGRSDHSRLVLAEVVLLEALERGRRLVKRGGRGVYGIYVVVLSIASLLPFWLLARILPSRRMVRKTVGLGARAYIFLSGCRLCVRGLDHLQGTSGSPLILVSNHASYLDPIPLLAGLPLDYAFVVKREAGRWPFIGTFIRGLGNVMVDRLDAEKSIESAQEVRRTLDGGRSVFFFPEGTFTPATGLRPFKLGAFKLAAETGRPVVPMTLRGTRRWLRDRSWIPRRSDLEIIVGEPLRPGSSSLSEVVRLRDQAAEVIARQLGEPRLDLVGAAVPSSRFEEDARS